MHAWGTLYFITICKMVTHLVCVNLLKYRESQSYSSQFSTCRINIHNIFSRSFERLEWFAESPLTTAHKYILIKKACKIFRSFLECFPVCPPWHCHWKTVSLFAPTECGVPASVGGTTTRVATNIIHSANNKSTWRITGKI
jgi:hypothetical protein